MEQVVGLRSSKFGPDFQFRHVSAKQVIVFIAPEASLETRAFNSSPHLLNDSDRSAGELRALDA